VHCTRRLAGFDTNSVPLSSANLNFLENAYFGELCETCVFYLFGAEYSDSNVNTPSGALNIINYCVLLQSISSSLHHINLRPAMWTHSL
jgi:hypothetical protein